MRSQVYSVQMQYFYTQSTQLLSNIFIPNQSKCVPITSSQAHHAEKMHVDPLARRNASFAPSSDVWKYITELGISKVGVFRT